MCDKIQLIFLFLSYTKITQIATTFGNASWLSCNVPATMTLCWWRPFGVTSCRTRRRPRVLWPPPTSGWLPCSVSSLRWQHNICTPDTVSRYVSRFSIFIITFHIRKLISNCLRDFIHFHN